MFLISLFSIIGVALAVENDILEIEAQGSYQMEGASSFGLAKKVAVFIAKRRAVDVAGRYLAKRTSSRPMTC
jgi:hypothetical protein